MTTQPFLALTAADLMSRHVVTIPQEMSLRAAAHLLAQSAISGAPVVDADGRCVGVISATDFVHWAEHEPPGRSGPLAIARPICSDWEVVEAELLPSNEVRHYMTADPVTVDPATPISDLARLMLDAHIHRLIVVDEAGAPVGVISSTDVLSAVAYADRRPFDG